MQYHVLLLPLRRIKKSLGENYKVLNEICGFVTQETLSKDLSFECFKWVRISRFFKKTV